MNIKETVDSLLLTITTASKEDLSFLADEIKGYPEEIRSAVREAYANRLLVLTQAKKKDQETSDDVMMLTVKAMAARLSSIEEKLDQVLAGKAAPQVVRAGSVEKIKAEPADDAELDSQWGDPVVKFDPAKGFANGRPIKWSPSLVGKKFSECPAQYLEKLAESFEHFASQAKATGETYTSKKGETKEVWPFKLKDAARARGWALRNANGATVKPVLSQTQLDDQIPF